MFYFRAILLAYTIAGPGDGSWAAFQHVFASECQNKVITQACERLL